MSADLVRSYARHHAHRHNVTLHVLGVPAIVFAIVLATTAAPAAVGLPVAVLLLALVGRYVFEDPLAGGCVAGFLGLSASAGIGLLSVLDRAVVLWSALALFAIGWIVQVVGHRVFERNGPAVLRDLRHLLVAPLFVAGEILGACGCDSRIARWQREACLDPRAPERG